MVSLAFMSVTFFTNEKIRAIYDVVVEKGILVAANKPEADMAAINALFSRFSKYFLGFVFFFQMLATLFNFQLSHFLSLKLKKNIRPKFDFLNLSSPYYISVIPIVSLTIANLVPGLHFTFSSLAVAGLFMPTVCGFSIVHFYAKERKQKNILVIAYLMLLIFPLLIILFMAAIGVIDSFFPVRRELQKKRY